MNKEVLDYWTADTKAYNTIQKLKKFIDFVAGLEDTTSEDQQKAQKIIAIIEKINQPEHFNYSFWSVRLDVYDRSIQHLTPENRGVWLRKWIVYFENQTLEIEAETYHSDEPCGHYGDDFKYFAAIYFKKDFSYERVDMKIDIDEFIKDAMNYKNYMTPTLKDIEIEFEIDYF